MALQLNKVQYLQKERKKNEKKLDNLIENKFISYSSKKERMK